MDVLKRWCDAMERTYTGKLTLNNIIHDFREGRVCKTVLRDFLHAVVAKWQDGDPKTSPEEAIRAVVHCNPDKYVCRGRRTFLNKRRCSRVMLAKDLIRDNVRTDVLGWTENPDYVPDEYIDCLEETSTDEFATGEMPAEAAFAWVTQTKQIDEIRDNEDGDEIANVVRERLGLLHYMYEHQFVEVRYPTANDIEIRLSPPTFLDGSPYIAYRSNKAPGNWGVTIDLATGEDGVPEAVHEPVPFSGGFTVRNIGWVNRTTTNVEFKKICSTSPHVWDSTGLDDLRKIWP